MNSKLHYRFILHVAAWVFGVMILQPPISAAPEAEPSLQVIERGPNHSVIQRIRKVFHPAEGWLTQTSRWTQLEDGLNYWDPDTHAWEESRDEIELTPQGAVARRGQHRAVFSSNANDPNGAIDFEVDHRVRLRSSVLALRYFDPVSGRSVVIATVKDAQAEWLPPNAVLYQDVFDHVRADLLYRYRKAGIEADVILREVPPDPTPLGISPEVARLEVVSEFFDPPNPIRRPRPLATVGDPVLRARVAQPDWIDEELDFGPNRFAAGRAFAWSSRNTDQLHPDSAPPVGKQWIASPESRRAYLVESVEYASLLEDLLALPGPKERIENLRRRAAAWAGRTVDTLRHDATLAALPRRAIPRATQASWPQRPASAFAALGPRALSLARLSGSSAPGVVIDWTSVGTGTSNMVFRGNETYLVTASCWFSGTTTLEGGAVIKFPKDTNAAFRAVNIYNGNLVCNTSPYRPAVFTAEDDNTVGETVKAGSPDPLAYYAAMPLHFWNVGQPTSVHDLRLKHGYWGIFFEGDCPDNLVRHSQFENCFYSIASDSAVAVRAENCLVSVGQFANGHAFWGSGTSFRGVNLTIRDTAFLLFTGTPLSTLVLTNCLLVGVTNLAAYSGSHNYVASTAPAVLDSVGAGRSYLPTSSPRRNAGSTNIDAILAADLRNLTTEAPQILSGTVSIDTTWSPRVHRDSDPPDLGYHYPPLDYAISTLAISNATLSLQQGVAVAVYGADGFRLGPYSRLVSEGLPQRPNRLVRFHAVQEGADPWAASHPYFNLILQDAPGASGDAAPMVRLRFTEIDHLAVSPTNYGGRHFLWAGGTTPVSTIELLHCRLGPLALPIGGPSACAQAVSIRNCVFDRSFLGIYDAAGEATNSVELRNNLFVGTSICLQNGEPAPFVVSDNLFASADLNLTGVTISSHNGFGAGTTAFGSNTKTNLTLDFASGPLGPYYYPTNGGGTSLATLVDAGSRSADQAGLYHFTTKAAVGSKEALDSNPTVDIGFHYPAVTSTGQASDTDGDGIPDVVEDRDGDGAVDADETDWNDPNGGPSGPSGLTVFTPLR